jgi:opacity protein-like surface antigen
MRLSVRMITTAAFAVFLMPAFNLFAEDAAKPSTGAKDDKASDSSIASAADSSASLPPDSMPAASMAAAMPYSRGLDSFTPRVEVFLGYSYLRAVPSPAEGNRLGWLNGGSASIAFNFNRYLGLVADFGGLDDTQLLFSGTGANPSTTADSSGTVFTYLFGPRLSFRGHDRLTPFGQVLFGGIHASQATLSSGCTGVGCTLLPSESKFAMTAGGGLDVKVNHRLAIRIIQAEYLMTNFEDRTTGASATQNDMRLSSGIVFRFGGNPAPPIPPPSPLAYACTVNPSSVFQGDAIAVSGTAVNLDPAKTATYTWHVDGGTVTGASSNASIDTRNLVAGAYTVKGHVSEGEKPNENADCSAPYAVKAIEPPTVSCAANPYNLISGESSTITATGLSPENRPLTYSYSSTAGAVSGIGATATLSTAGAPVGSITVTCNTVDDKGLTASGTTAVTVAAPVAAPKPLTSELCAIHFDRDLRRPNRVDNEGKACLDEIALNLQRNSDAQLVIVGNTAGQEIGGNKLATQRAINTKAYLVSEKGIDPARIAVYTGSQDGKIVSTTLIPAGAAFDSTGDTPVR